MPTQSAPASVNSPLRLVIDGNEANVTRRVGSNVYAFEIIRTLAELIANRSEIKVTVVLSQPPQADLPPVKPNWEYRVLKPKPFWTQWALPVHLFWHRSDYDVLFTPGHYAPRVSSVPYISSVMDLAFLKYPESFQKKDFLQLKAWTEYSVKHAAKVVAISQFTKQEVKRVYRRKEADIIVAPPSVANLTKRYSRRGFDRFCRRNQITGPYWLYLGTLQPRKNLVKLIEAFETVAAQTEAKLVLAGKVGWLAEEILQKIKVSPVKDRIILTDFVPDQYKYPLYKEALGAVMLSPYEGFGIPALEAMASGTLPIVADSSSLPEVVGEAGIMVNPDKIESIAKGLLKALQVSAKERAQLRKLGRDQIKKFSWQASAKVILDELVALGKK
jgi:glycosyltransferase involved in cell wall biosynthesis